MLDTLDTTANTRQWKNMLEMLGAYTGSIEDKALMEDGFLEFESLITAYMDKLVRSFLKTKKRLIYRAFKTYEGAALHYCIILYNDNLTNRGKLYAFSQKFLYTGYGRRFPVVFQFIPREMETELKTFETLDMNEHFVPYSAKRRKKRPALKLTKRKNAYQNFSKPKPSDLDAFDTLILALAKDKPFFAKKYIKHDGERQRGSNNHYMKFLGLA